MGLYRVSFIADYKHSALLRWYRGLVLSINDMKDILEIFFVDYGDTEWIPRSATYPIHPSLLQVLRIHFKVIH